MSARRLQMVVIAVLAAIVGYGLLAGDETQENRAHAIGSRLACPQCQGESVADSQAPIAATMRTIIDEQLAGGRSDGEIIEFFRASYGDVIVLDPPRRGMALLLWITPLVGLGLGLVLIARRRRPKVGSTNE